MSASIDQTVIDLTTRIQDLEDFIARKFGPTGGVNTYGNPYDQFYAHAGALPSYLMNIAPFSIGPNGSLTQEGFTWTNNSPGAGQIAWSNGVIVYQGVQYTISAGNTSNFWVYWQKSNPNVFQTAPQQVAGIVRIPAIGQDDFIIAINDTGVWHSTINFSGPDGHRVIIHPDAIFLCNNVGIVVVDVGINPTENGIMSLWNAAGTKVYQISAGDGRITFPTSGAPVAGRTLAGYVPVVSANGTNYYMAVYT